MNDFADGRVDNRTFRHQVERCKLDQANVVAVTGAAGLIGSSAFAALVAAGIPVRILAGPAAETRRASLGAEMCIHADITDIASLESLFQGVTTVVHAAGPPSVTESMQNPMEFMRVHALGTTAVLEACVRMHVRRIVHISSAEVYGNTSSQAVLESQPLLASSPYGAAKIGAEQMVRAFAIAGRVRAVVLRPFSVYGPGMSTDGVVAQFLRQAFSQSVIHVRDPRPVRDFCFISDIAQAVVSACSVPLKGFEVANLGSGIATSIGDLALLADELGGSCGTQERGEKRPAGTDVVRLVANTDHARDLLGWSATISLRDGLKRTMDWVKMQ